MRRISLSHFGTRDVGVCARFPRSKTPRLGLLRESYRWVERRMVTPERCVDSSCSELKWVSALTRVAAERSQHTCTCELPSSPRPHCEAVTCLDASLHLDGSNSPVRSLQANCNLNHHHQRDVNQPFPSTTHSCTTTTRIPRMARKSPPVTVMQSARRRGTNSPPPQTQLAA